ncbi:MAG TPA: hypothetical protein VEW93_04490 [Acidimicrobiales bacterium]|jgi:hypothetical protein|nr:hypothetical protein [Acidimicrobiales bacterium]
MAVHDDGTEHIVAEARDLASSIHANIRVGTSNTHASVFAITGVASGMW